MLAVTLNIAPQFWSPVGLLGPWLSSVRASCVLMPETSVDKDDFLAARKSDIWFSWQIGAVEAKSVSERMDQLSDDHFGRRILASDAAHIFAPASWVELIHRSFPDEGFADQPRKAAEMLQSAILL
jgi:hypothetical protein